MFFEYFLHLIVAVSFKLVDQLLDRHQLHRHHGVHICLVQHLCHLAHLLALVQESVQGQSLRVGPYQAHRFYTLDLLITLLSLVSVLRLLLHRLLALSEAGKLRVNALRRPILDTAIARTYFKSLEELVLVIRLLCD